MMKKRLRLRRFYEKLWRRSGRCKNHGSVRAAMKPLKVSFPNAGIAGATARVKSRSADWRQLPPAGGNHLIPGACEFVQADAQAFRQSSRAGTSSIHNLEGVSQDRKST